MLPLAHDLHLVFAMESNMSKHFKIRILALAAGTTVIASGATLAQTQPATQLTPPQSASPFWGGESGMPAGYGDRSREAEDSVPFPDDLVARVAPARAQFAAMEQQLHATLRQIRERTAASREGFEANDEYRGVLRDLADARIRVEAARSEAIATLGEDDTYNAANALANQLANRIVAEHARDDTDADLIRELSEEALSYSEQRSQLEQAALDDSASYTEAIDELRTLAEQRMTMERAYEQGIRNDAELLALHRAAMELRAHVAAAEAFADSATQAANVAIDYAYTRTARQYSMNDRNGYDYGSHYYTPYYGGYGFQGRFPGVIIGVSSGFVSQPSGPPVISNIYRNQGTAENPTISNVGR